MRRKKTVAVAILVVMSMMALSAVPANAQEVGDLYTGGLYTRNGDYIDPASLPTLPEGCGWYVGTGTFPLNALCYSPDTGWRWAGDGHPFTGAS